jgi:hypothetical protein
MKKFKVPRKTPLRLPVNQDQALLKSPAEPDYNSRKLSSLCQFVQPMQVRAAFFGPPGLTLLIQQKRRTGFLPSILSQSPGNIDRLSSDFA